jgi:hypothetical protein
MKGDVICDYHGEVTRSMSIDDYVREKGIDGSFCVEVKGPNRRIIDATKEICPHHRDRRCLGRLANHAGLVTKNGGRRRVIECNMKLIDVNFNRNLLPEAPPYIAVFIATRTIKPLEELRFDYADRIAQEQFSQ